MSELRGFTSDDFIQVDGIHLRNRNGKGDIVHLHGTNLGGWLHREGWMDGVGNITRTLPSDGWQLTELTPAGDTEQALRQMLGQAETSWSAGSLEASNGAGFVLSLGSMQTFNTLRMECENRPQARPAYLQVAVSENGQDWEEVRVFPSPFGDKVEYNMKPVTAAYIRVKQVGEQTGAPWVISLLQLIRTHRLEDFQARQLLETRFGAITAERLRKAYEGSYITEADLDYLKGLGFNFVRLPIYWQMLLDHEGEFKPDAFDAIDWLVEQCGKRRLYVMLDLHGSPGGHSDGYQSGGQIGANELWTNETYQEWDVRIWRTLAERFKGNPTVCAYDLLNEPMPPKDGDTLNAKDMFDRLYREIRAIDPDHVISMNAFYTLDFLCDPKEYGWTNVLYQTHHYDAPNLQYEDRQRGFKNHQLNYLKEHQKKWQVPLMAGEFSYFSWLEVWKEWLAGLNEMGISWSNWTYKNITPNNISNPSLFYGFDGEFPDYEHDTPAQILQKWGAFGTEHYRENTPLVELLSSMAQAMN